MFEVLISQTDTFIAFGVKGALKCSSNSTQSSCAGTWVLKHTHS